MTNRRATCGKRGVNKWSRVDVILYVNYSYFRDVEVTRGHMDNEKKERRRNSRSRDMLGLKI